MRPDQDLRALHVGVDARVAQHVERAHLVRRSCARCDRQPRIITRDVRSLTSRPLFRRVEVDARIGDRGELLDHAFLELRGGLALARPASVRSCSVAGAHFAELIAADPSTTMLTSGWRARMPVAAAETAAVSSRRTPGGSSMAGPRVAVVRAENALGTISGRRWTARKCGARRRGSSSGAASPSAAPADTTPSPDRPAWRLWPHLERVGGDHRGQETRHQQREEHRRGHRQPELLEDTARRCHP